MAEPKGGRLDRDLAAYIENANDGGTDRRVNDQIAHEKLDNISAALGNPQGEVVNIFNTISSVPAEVVNSVVVYTVPVGKKLYLQKIQVGGDLWGRFTAVKGPVAFARFRTNPSSPLTIDMDFVNTNDLGLEFAAGDVITVFITHSRPFLGVFEGRIVGILQDA